MNKFNYFLLLTLIIAIASSVSVNASTYTVNYTSNGTFIAPQNSTNTSSTVVYVIVEAWGAGGGGGGARGNENRGGGGGGGGAYSRSTLALTPGQSYNVTIGTGGIAGTGSPVVNAFNGSSSWFNSTSTLLAVGGIGGNTTAAGTGGGGGIGGNASNNIGDYTFWGGNGASGSPGGAGTPAGGGGGGGGNQSAGGNATAPSGGGGGNFNGGNGSSGSSVDGNGILGLSPGGGGSGGFCDAACAAKDGGAGSNGQITLTYQTGAISITIYDESTSAILNTTTSTVYFSGTTGGYNYTTTTGILNANPVTPDTYIITFTANGYNQRQIIYTLTSQSPNNLQLYLLSASNSTTIETFYQDQNLQRIAGANVTMSRKNLSGTNYFDVYGCVADTNGRCLINAQTVTATYKICYSYNTFSACTGDIQFSSNDASIGRIFSLSTTTSNNNFNSWNNLQQTAGITFLPNSSTANGSVLFRVQNPSLIASSACLYLYRVTGSTKVLENTACQSGTIVTDVNAYINLSSGGDSILADGYVTVGGVDYLISTNTLLISSDLGTTGKRLSLLVIVLAVLLTVIFSYSWNPVAPPLIAGFVLYVFWSIGLLVISFGLVMSLVGIGLLVWLIIGRKA